MFFLLDIRLLIHWNISFYSEYKQY
ncbi:UNVERIFIED_CONTAM: hypothetical protein NCL1_63488 [Trichonephila clavipes]